MGSIDYLLASLEGLFLAMPRGVILDHLLID